MLTTSSRRIRNSNLGESGKRKDVLIDTGPEIFRVIFVFCATVVSQNTKTMLEIPGSASGLKFDLQISLSFYQTSDMRHIYLFYVDCYSDMSDMYLNYRAYLLK